MLIVRMRLQGATNRQTFRVVVTDERNPRDGKYIEMVGWYSPLVSNEKNAQIDFPRLQYWLDQGAALSERVEALIKRLSPEVAREISAKRVARRNKVRQKRQQKS